MNKKLIYLLVGLLVLAGVSFALSQTELLQGKLDGLPTPETSEDGGVLDSAPGLGILDGTADTTVTEDNLIDLATDTEVQMDIAIEKNGEVDSYSADAYYYAYTAPDQTQLETFQEDIESLTNEAEEAAALALSYHEEAVDLLSDYCDQVDPDTTDCDDASEAWVYGTDSGTEYFADLASSYAEEAREWADEVAEYTIESDGDTDGDGMPDAWENEYGLDPTTDDAMKDPDNDILPNIQEFIHHTDPTNFDSDWDMIPDGIEVDYGLDPLDQSDGRADFDGDLLNNEMEIMTYGTNIHKADTDDDGVNDYDEINAGTDPLVSDLEEEPEEEDDADSDGIADDSDNCPDNANEDQADTDGDGTGDVCDDSDDSETDTDSDGIADDSDNCPNDANEDQADTDGDGTGDVCDDSDDSEIDTDGDGIADDSDNCPDDANSDQEDEDGDGYGDACDSSGTPTESDDDEGITDADGDGILDEDDNCPGISNEDQTDTDGDGEGDACDLTEEEILTSEDYECEHSFEDIRGHWAEDKICRWAALGFVKGRSTNSFEPDANITRGEWIKLLVLNAGFTEDDASGKYEDFADITSGDWEYPYIVVAQNEDVIRTRDFGEFFNSGTAMTRGDAVLYTIRMAEETLYGWDEDDIGFSDISISDYFAYAVLIANGTEVYVPGVGIKPVIEGFSNGTYFYPYNYITRAEAITVLYRSWLAWFNDM